jgi:cytochrome c551/c552
MMRAQLLGLMGLVLVGCVGRPKAGEPVTPPGEPPAANEQAPPPAPQERSPKVLVQSHGCLECHSLDARVVGPSFREIAARYKNEDRRGYELQLMYAAKTDDIPAKRTSAIVVAQVGTYLQVRVFDADGSQVADKTEDTLVAGPEFAQLKQRWSEFSKIPPEALPAAERQRIVDGALTASGLTLDQARQALAAKITHGGKGNWTAITNGVPMPPFSRRLSSEQIDVLVQWILSL